MGKENFVAKMNEKAKLFGFKKTSLFGPSGLDEEGSKMSAWEIAKLGEYLLYNEKLGEIMHKGTYMLYDAQGNFKRKIFTTNELWGIEGLYAAKTGFTDEAQGNLLLIIKHPKKADEFLISVVLGSEDRARDTTRLLELAR
jgi:D-alanyl-D-alanine carboxypeptidase